MKKQENPIRQQTEMNMAGPKSTSNQASKLMTVREVAELDGTSEKTVRRAIDAGLLAVVRIGPGRRSIRIHPDAHAAYRRGSIGY
jgi:excisionase family DNA binding protein